jgi:hypothetical protein
MYEKIDSIKKKDSYFFLELYEDNIINLFLASRCANNSHINLDNLNSEQNQLNREIARESISYLKIKSSHKILSDLIHYIFHKLNEEHHDFFDQLKYDDNQKIYQMIKIFPDAIVEFLSYVDYINCIKNIVNLEYEI